MWITVAYILFLFKINYFPILSLKKERQPFCLLSMKFSIWNSVSLWYFTGNHTSKLSFERLKSVRMEKNLQFLRRKYVTEGFIQFTEKFSSIGWKIWIASRCQKYSNTNSFKFQIQLPIKYVHISNVKYIIYLVLLISKTYLN